MKAPATHDGIDGALEERLAIDAELKRLNARKAQLNTILDDYIEENGAGDFPSDTPGKVIRLKRVVTTKAKLDNEGLWKALPPDARKGLFDTVHIARTEALEAAMTESQPLADEVREHLTVTKTVAVRVDLVNEHAEETP